MHTKGKDMYCGVQKVLARAEIAWLAVLQKLRR